MPVVPRPSQFTVVDLFSGAGGMSRGFASLRSRFRLIGAVDTQVGKPGRGTHSGTYTDCNRTYAANLKIRPLNIDLSDVSPRQIRSVLKISRPPDVLIACPPCTGFSQKDPSNHYEDDPRNGLVARVAKFVDELEPRFLVMENVRGLVTGPHKHHFDRLKRELDALAYSVWWDVIDFSRHGLPQRRSRLILIASRDRDVSPLPEFNGSPPTVRDTIGHLPAVDAGETHPTDPMHVSPRLTDAVLRRMQAIPKDGGSWGDVLDNPELSDEDKESLLIPSMLNGPRNSFPDVYGRLAWDEPAVTITRECAHVGNGRFAHPEQDRLLTVREMALLQGFPKSYQFKGTLRAKYNQIGDAVPPLIAKRIARHITKIADGRC